MLASSSSHGAASCSGSLVSVPSDTPLWKPGSPFPVASTANSFWLDMGASYLLTPLSAGTLLKQTAYLTCGRGLGHFCVQARISCSPVSPCLCFLKATYVFLKAAILSMLPEEEVAVTNENVVALFRWAQRCFCHRDPGGLETSDFFPSHSTPLASNFSTHRCGRT